MDVLQQGVKAIGDFLGPEKSRSLREKAFGVGESQYTNPAPTAQEGPSMSPVAESVNWGNTEPSTTSTTIPTPEIPIAQEEANMGLEWDVEGYTWKDGDSYFSEDPEEAVDPEEEDDGQEGALEADTGALPEGVGLTPQAAKKAYHEEIKGYENPRELGLKGSTFKPIRSMEGRGSDKENSEYEIGYGIKIKESWLTDNRKAWPKINGVPVDVRKGISKRQAEDWSLQYQEQAYASAKGIVGSPWKDMTEREKIYWSDLVYNLGEAGTKKNSKALKLMNKGLPVEAAIATLDSIHVNGKPNLGIFKRRVKMYNELADSLPGVPRIEEYSFSKGIKVKFSSSFFSDKVSKGLAKAVHTSKGWMPIASNLNHKGSAIVEELE